MTNEQIVEKIRNGYSVTENMQLLYESNLPLIKRIIKPYTAYENAEDLLQETRIPSYARQKMIRYNKTVQKLTQEQGRTPTDYEIADST